MKPNILHESIQSSFNQDSIHHSAVTGDFKHTERERNSAINISQLKANQSMNKPLQTEEVVPSIPIEDSFGDMSSRRRKSLDKEIMSLASNRRFDKKVQNQKITNLDLSPNKDNKDTQSPNLVFPNNQKGSRMYQYTQGSQVISEKTDNGPKEERESSTRFQYVNHARPEHNRERWVTETAYTDENCTERPLKPDRSPESRLTSFRNYELSSRSSMNGELRSSSRLMNERDQRQQRNNRFRLGELEDIPETGLNNSTRDRRNREIGQQEPNRNNRVNNLPNNGVSTAQLSHTHNQTNMQLPNVMTNQNGIAQEQGNGPFDEQMTREKLEARLYVYSRIPLFLGLCLLSFFMQQVIKNNISFQSLFVICGCYLIYYSVENILKICAFDRESWRKSEDFYNVFDALGGLTFLAFVDMKICGLIPFSMVALVPTIVTTVIYTLSSKAPKVIKLQAALTRIYYMLQFFFITAKLDKTVDCDWRLSFGVSWVYFGIMSLYPIAYTLLFLLGAIFAFFGRRLLGNMGIYTQLIGIFWHIPYYGESFIVLAGVLGVAEAYGGPENFNIIDLASSFGFYINGCLIVYTLFTLKTLTQFFEGMPRDLGQGNNSDEQETNKKEPGTIKLEVEKKESYFIMLSSTYFVPWDNKFFKASQKKLTELKETVANSKVWKSRGQNKEVKKDKPVQIQELKQYKKVLDKRFVKKTARADQEGNKVSQPAKLKLPTIISEEASANERGLEDMDIIKTKKRINLSADDMKLNIKELENSVQEGKICYLCYDNPSNAILMNCGHGGICYKCASDLVQRKNECMECRSQVEMIIKLDPNQKLPDMIKGVEICKVQIE